MTLGRSCSYTLFVTLVLLSTRMLLADPVRVRHTEGLVHGFLALRDVDGSTLADGDLSQVASGSQVTSRLTFHFRDGSLHDETAVFSQRQQFRLISDHVVQKGPVFPQPLELFIDGASGQVTVHYTDEHGVPKVAAKRFNLPPDLANGLIPTLLKNITPDGPPPALSMIATTPEPRLVKLVVTRAGDDPFSTGAATRRATHYVLKVDIGGISGLIAPLVGKQPPDSHVWILHGDAPAFVRSEQPLFLGGPLWRIELVGPTWPRASA